jgi:23S rRNA pseudouridine955/2504/2580 synthase
MMKKRIKIENLPVDIRIDRWLKENYEIPFSIGQKLIRKGKIKVNDKKTKYNFKIKNDDIVDIHADITENKRHVKPVNKKLYDSLLAEIKDNIILKDQNIIAINKPPGIAVQGGSKIKISIDDILNGLQFDYLEKPKLVHRIDRHTSGVLLLARTTEIAQALTKLFKNKKISKKYLAVLAGNPRPKEGIIKSTLAKTKIMDKEKVTSSTEGKQAITEYRILENLGKGVSLAEFTPITGRTHQIRVHATEYLHAPILGDEKYGGEKAKPKGIIESKLHLHASEVIIENLQGKSYHIRADLPLHMQATLKIFH